MYLPLHVRPSPVYPGLQVHLYAPGVFVQVAKDESQSLEPAHSSVSEITSSEMFAKKKDKSTILSDYVYVIIDSQSFLWISVKGWARIFLHFILERGTTCKTLSSSKWTSNFLKKILCLSKKSD